MKVWHYENEILHLENCAVPALAEKYETPFYVYSFDAMQKSHQQFMKNMTTGAELCYSAKANSNQAILSLFAQWGTGADIVSRGEGKRALAAGIAPEKIYFSGAGKTYEDLTFALDAGIGQINVESARELERLAQLAQQKNKCVPIAFRVNPDVKAGGHEKISTGKRGDKFGIVFEEAEVLYKKASESPLFDVKGLAVHIGSQIFELDVFQTAWDRLGAFADKLRQQGFVVEKFDLGGGLGINTEINLLADIDAYSQAAMAFAARYDCRIVLSPGRSLVGLAGGLVLSVIEEKISGAQTFLILDGASNDFMRPALYNVNHPVLPVRKSKASETIYQLAGPVCESGDMLGYDVRLPRQEADDLLVLAEAGAYGAVLSSNYNSRLAVPEVLVKGDDSFIIRPRQTYQNLIERDEVPEWIKN